MKSLLGLLLFFVTGAALASGFPIPPYQASYSIAWGGMHVGNMEINLSREKGGNYRYRSVTNPAGLASLFASDVVTETSEFEMDGDMPRSLHYAYSQNGGKHDKSEDVDFDWIRGVADFQEDEHRKSVQIATGIYDRFLAQLLLSAGSADAKLPAEMRVLDHREITTYVVKNLEKTSVKTEDATFEDIPVVELRQDKSQAATRLYLSPAMHYLPVEIELLRPGRSTVTIVLTSMSFNLMDATAPASKQPPTAASQGTEQK